MARSAHSFSRPLSSTTTPSRSGNKMTNHHLPGLFESNESASVCSIRSKNSLPASKQPCRNILDGAANLKFEDVFRINFKSLDPCAHAPPVPPCKMDSALEEIWSPNTKRKMARIRFAEAVRRVNLLVNLTSSKRTTPTADISDNKPSTMGEKTNEARREPLQHRASFTTYRHPLCDPNNTFNISQSKKTKSKSTVHWTTLHQHNSIPSTETHFPELSPLRREKGGEDSMKKDEGWKGSREWKQDGNFRCVVDDPRGCIEEAIWKRRGYCPTNPCIGSKLRRNKLVKSLS